MLPASCFLLLTHFIFRLLHTSQTGRSTVRFQLLQPFLCFSIGSDHRQILQGDKAPSFGQQFSISGENDGVPMLLSLIICLHSFAECVAASGTTATAVTTPENNDLIG